MGRVFDDCDPNPAVAQPHRVVYRGRWVRNGKPVGPGDHDFIVTRIYKPGAELK